MGGRTLWGRHCPRPGLKGLGGILASRKAPSLEAVLLPTLAPAETPPPDLPAAVAPARTAGSGLNVIDLEAQRTRYISMLGMSVTATYQRDGAPFEYVMGLKAPGAILALLKAPRPPGPNGFGRVILETPDAKALGRRSVTAQSGWMNSYTPP
jgi:hypothetical protein